MKMKEVRFTIIRSKKAAVFFAAITVFSMALSSLPIRWGQAAGLGNCTRLSLRQGSSEGAAGTVYKHAVITNNGPKTCTITGYPGVFMQDSSGMQVGSGAAANSLYNVTTVILSPNAEAHVVLAFPQQPNFPPGTCSPIGSSMKFYVPGLARALVAPWSDYSCPGFSVTAIRAGE